MNESFLQYVWQLQYFNKSDLTTTAGEKLNIIKPGILNGDAGPDFTQARVQIDSIEWNGSVEVHIQSSGWIEHKHQDDPAYENVVLHVVWQEIKPVYRKDGTRLPTLEIKDRVDSGLLKSFQKLVNTSATIPCERYFPQVDPIVKHAMIDRALMKRLEAKAARVMERLNENQGDWEQTTYQVLASNMGFKINQEPFDRLAHALPYKIVQKHSHNLVQLEALLFGQAGFLVAKSKDTYVTELFKEYQFLSNKYQLQKFQLTASQWKFLRLRPANFPTLRIAQLAALLQKSRNLCSAILEATEFTTLAAFFDVQASDYWKTHYRFGKPAKGAPAIGISSVENMLINTVAPLLVAYGQQHDDMKLIDRAVTVLQALPAENNKVTRLWNSLGYTSKTAVDSQGLLELYTSYCKNRECLNCQIGNSILKPQPL